MQLLGGKFTNFELILIKNSFLSSQQKFKWIYKFVFTIELFLNKIWVRCDASGCLPTLVVVAYFRDQTHVYAEQKQLLLLQHRYTCERAAWFDCLSMSFSRMTYFCLSQVGTIIIDINVVIVNLFVCLSETTKKNLMWFIFAYFYFSCSLSLFLNLFSTNSMC